MVIAANAPDFDAVTFFMGGPTYIRWHRNITHSLIAIPVMALVTLLVVRLLGRKQIRWLPAFLIAIVGVASHIVLDLTNVYGVRILLPFSGQWFHWDMTPIFDLTLWAILLLGVIAPWFGRLVGSEIGEHKGRPGKGWAIACLVLFTAFDYGRLVLHDRAAATVDSFLYSGQKPLRAGAFPDENPLIWGGIAELNDSYVSGTVDLRERFRPNSVVRYYKAQRTPVVDAAMQTVPFRRFLEFVQWPIWQTEPAPDLERATRVSLIDLRFGTPSTPGFEAVATVNDRGQVVDSAFTFGTPRPK